MKLKDVTRPKEPVTRNVSITIRTTKEVSDWMKSRNISPTLIWDTAIEELMSQDKDWEKEKPIEDLFPDEDEE